MAVDSLASIVAFVHAAEQQSYVAAARLAGVSPSAIGKAVARLESRLGVRLFNRTTRSISLTEEGTVLYEHYKRVLDDMRDAEAAVSKGRDRPRGRLRVSVPHIVGHHLLMPILPGFTARFPEIELDIDFEDRVIDLITEGLDVVVRSGELADARLIARPLGEQHFVVCASPAYLDRHGRPETPDDLSRHACIHFKYPSTGRTAPWAFRPPSERLLLPRSLTFNNTDAGLRAARDGLGLAHLPVYVAEPHIRAGTLIPVLTAFMAPFGSLSLVWPSNRQLSPKIRAFVDFVVENFGGRLGTPFSRFGQ
ncbi:LysR family transcriptional regulator protein (plasmid) [Rhizobium phaseoli]|uniref:HTH-type transcriptional regulator TtuA n=1 Tax=Rhizobium etli (strain CIAT 652) TaxID=491916 RepID=B3Q3M8_RHIE6|nr:probable transcriptional regulator protein, LysR family [Rhizobium etli CIAT 652]ANL50883.1 LysR family transcriptional regulator protein [Rhizobium phaseoli]ARM16338.1 LysR family transcriptional regulator protein [Rhizobium phaseoli Brasil 5]EGE61236.1 putative LysR family transcriptional regulator [Rhizobium etli CNPAF512]NKF08918.1 LysR family transcriptional regulator [Rhizobium phaseoli]